MKKDKFTVNYHSKVPVYKQLIQHFEGQIAAGKYKVGDLLPSMNELAADLDISKETVKKAYSLLRDQGIVETKLGKGCYVAPSAIDRQTTVLVLFDKLSLYKQVLFDSFTETLGKDVNVTILLHNQDVDLFEYYLNEHLDKYDYYVITPHFPNDAMTQKRVLKILRRIPNRKLIILDREMPELSGHYGTVYQDFSNDIYDGLSYGLDKLRTFDCLNVLTLKSSMYGAYICKAIRRFCDDNNLKVEFYSEVNPQNMKRNEVYLVLNNQLDTGMNALVRVMHERGFEVGKDISIISYNESPLNDLILNGLTAVSTDFRKMGVYAAEMINNKQMEKIKCDFVMVRRSSF
ncbi:MAG: GntR family transcriptional regulator [Bacteroidales bacterium]|nr:GntR family transcriptional regulator [Bacteroidales bacterium]